MKDLGGNVITAHNLVMYSLLTERIESCITTIVYAHNLVMYSLLELGWKCNNGS